jgi:signal transduction histidine kinase
MTCVDRRSRSPGPLAAACSATFSPRVELVLLRGAGPLDDARSKTENFKESSCGRSITLDARQVEVLRKTLDQLRVEVAELRGSRERLVLAAHADRRRIERDLHESVRQHLVALAVNLQRVRLWMDTDPVAARELLDEMDHDVQLALDETAGLAERIYPALLDVASPPRSVRLWCVQVSLPPSTSEWVRTAHPRSRQPSTCAVWRRSSTLAPVRGRP